MGLIIKWDCTYHCNLNCKHCINGDYLNDTNEELDTNDFEKIIDDIENTYKIDYLHMLGGEPTTKKDFFEICEILDKRKISFGFNTNGLIFKNNLSKDIISKKYLKSIVFSIEGHNEKLNDEIRGKKVFSRIIRSINEANKNKKKYNSNVSLEVNFVLSKKNYKYISNMIDLCLKIDVQKLNILQMLEEGNAKNSGYSISLDEQIYAMKEISKKRLDIKNKLIVDPKFTRPMASKYMKEVLNCDFPESMHGCGAGLNFAFMDNKGKLFFCDGARKKDLKVKYNDLALKENKFKDVWRKNYFSIPFSVMESSVYKNLYPCKSCEYFSKTCFPCPLDIKDDTVMNECIFYFDQIYRKTFSCIKPVKESIRFLHNNDSSITAISTRNLNVIKLNPLSFDILENIMDGNIKEYTSLKYFLKNNKINIVEGGKFLEYLKERGFILYE